MPLETEGDIEPAVHTLHGRTLLVDPPIGATACGLRGIRNGMPGSPRRQPGARNRHLPPGEVCIRTTSLCPPTGSRPFAFSGSSSGRDPRPRPGARRAASGAHPSPRGGHGSGSPCRLWPGCCQSWEAASEAPPRGYQRSLRSGAQTQAKDSRAETLQAKDSHRQPDSRVHLEYKGLKNQRYDLLSE
jgi:hypothetical protein